MPAEQNRPAAAEPAFRTALKAAPRFPEAAYNPNHWRQGKKE